MKKILTLFIILCGFSVYAQATYHYKIKLNAVTNIAEAKNITDPLRYYFKTYPTFEDATDYFEFDSDADVTLADLTALLNGYSYTISEFYKTAHTSTPAAPNHQWGTYLSLQPYF